MYMLLFMYGRWVRGEWDITFWEIASDFLSFKYNSFMWFFIPLICIYLTLPFLRVFVVNAERRLLRLFIVMSVSLNVAACFFKVEGGNNFYDIYLFGTRYLLFTVAGYYFGNYQLSDSFRRRLYVAGVVSVAVIFIGTSWCHLNMPENYGFFLNVFSQLMR